MLSNHQSYTINIYHDALNTVPLRFISPTYCLKTETARHSRENQSKGSTNQRFYRADHKIVGRLDKRLSCVPCMQRSDLRGRGILPHYRSTSLDHSVCKARKYRHQKLDHKSQQSDFDKNQQCGNKIFLHQL